MSDTEACNVYEVDNYYFLLRIVGIVNNLFDSLNCQSARIKLLYASTGYFISDYTPRVITCQIEMQKQTHYLQTERLRFQKHCRTPVFVKVDKNEQITLSVMRFDKFANTICPRRIATCNQLETDYSFSCIRQRCK